MTKREKNFGQKNAKITKRSHVYESCVSSYSKLLWRGKNYMEMRILAEIFIFQMSM